MSDTEKEATAGELQPAKTLADISPDAPAAGVMLVTDIMTSLCAAFGLRPALQDRAASLREEGEPERAEALEAFAERLGAPGQAAEPAAGLPTSFPKLPVANAAKPEVPSEPVAPAAEMPKYILTAPFWSPSHSGRAGDLIEFSGAPSSFMTPLNEAARARVAAVGRR
jgi:hypothetical protein